MAVVLVTSRRNPCPVQPTLPAGPALLLSAQAALGPILYQAAGGPEGQQYTWGPQLGAGSKAQGDFLGAQAHPVSSGFLVSLELEGLLLHPPLSKQAMCGTQWVSSMYLLGDLWYGCETLDERGCQGRLIMHLWASEPSMNSGLWSLLQGPGPVASWPLDTGEQAQLRTAILPGRMAAFPTRRLRPEASSDGSAESQTLSFPSSVCSSSEQILVGTPLVGAKAGETIAVPIGRRSRWQQKDHSLPHGLPAPLSHGVVVGRGPQMCSLQEPTRLSAPVPEASCRAWGWTPRCGVRAGCRAWKGRIHIPEPNIPQVWPGWGLSNCWRPRSSARGSVRGGGHGLTGSPTWPGSAVGRAPHTSQACPRRFHC